MTTLLFVLPWVASVCGAAFVIHALRLWEVQSVGGDNRKRLWLLASFAVLFPSLAHAQGTDLQTAVESTNAIIMYLSGVFAAIGIVAAGISMMTGRHAIAKWALAGAMVSGLAFAIVRSIWTNAGLTAPEVGGFAP
jgi:type IV secretory pathway VirB2 component (pilin)